MRDELDDVRRALVRTPRELTGRYAKRSAVAAIFTPGRRLWFMRRAERKGDPWSGHLAFPGGREEPEDPDLLAVSIRETWEEVGVDLREAELLGQLDDMSSRPARSMLVRPFVFALHREPVFRTNEEVASMHSTTLDRLLANEGRGTMRWPHHTVGMRLPRVDFDGQRLWGMTLRMVDDLLHRVDGGGMDLDRLASS